MAQHLLNLTKVSSTIKHMRGSRVPQGMGSDVGHTGLTSRLMNHLANLPLTNPATQLTQEEGLTCFVGRFGR